MPDGWRERWRLLREFIDRWHQFSLGDVGGRADEIRELEARLGQTLPPSLREFVAFVLDLREGQYYPDALRDYFEMRNLRTVAAIALLWQDEGDYVWAVRHADLALPDPPVYGFGRDDEDPDDRTLRPDPGNPVAGSVTGFVLGRVLDSYSGAGGSFRTGVRRPDPLRRDLEATFPVHSHYQGRDLFEGENFLVQLYPSPVARDTEFYVRVARPLPREAVPAFLWDYINNGGGFHGMFAEAHIRARELRLPGHNDRRAGEAEDIPF